MLGANMQNASLGPGNLKPLDLQLGHMLGKPSPSCTLGWLSTCSQWPLHIPPFSLQADCSAVAALPSNNKNKSPAASFKAARAISVSQR